MEPIAIAKANTATNRPDIYKNGLDEITTATLEFPGGVIAEIKTSFGENINFLDITCAKGAIHMSPFSAYSGVKGRSPLGEINHPYEIPWQQANQMDNDAMSILKRQPMRVLGEEGLRDIRIVEAIYKAASSGQRTKV